MSAYIGTAHRFRRRGPSRPGVIFGGLIRSVKARAAGIAQCRRALAIGHLSLGGARNALWRRQKFSSRTFRFKDGRQSFDGVIRPGERCVSHTGTVVAMA